MPKEDAKKDKAAGKAETSIDVTEKKKKRALVIILCIILGLAFLVVMFHSTPTVYKKPVDHSLIQVTPADDSMHQWTVQGEEQLKQLSSTQQKLLDQLKEQNQLITTLHTKMSSQSSALSDLQAQLSKTEQEKAAKVMNVQGPHPGLQTFQGGSSPQNPYAQEGAGMGSQQTMYSGTMQISKPPLSKADLAKKEQIYAFKKNRFIGWLPMGSFFKGTLLNGIEAGTGTSAQANPQPVLIRILGNAYLPNEYRYKVKSCFVLGSAYGSLSSERAFIRTARISCVGFDGRAVISSPLKGYVVDSDGKIGLRGTLVNKQGAKLAKAMLSGFFAGLSGAAGQAQSTTSIGASGVVSTISPTQAMRMAGLSGASNAANELAQFYIDEAKQLFPVIEVNTGRNVMIDVSGGVSLTWKPTDKKFIPEETTPKPVTTAVANVSEGTKTADTQAEQNVKTVLENSQLVK